VAHLGGGPDGRRVLRQARNVLGPHAGAGPHDGEVIGERGAVAELDAATVRIQAHHLLMLEVDLSPV
jgi:hypothetical protein